MEPEGSSFFEKDGLKYSCCHTGKEEDPFEWGGVFAMNPDRKYLTDAEYDEMIEKIKANL